MNSLRDFSVKERFDYQNSLTEAIETILSANIALSSNKSTSQSSLEMIVEPLRKLKEAQAFFAPKLTVHSLSDTDFNERGLTLSRFFQKQLISNNFYLVQVPITLKPSFGWSFARLECWLGFNSNDAKIHDLYPDDEWTDILNVQTRLSLGIDDELNFKAAFEPNELKTEFPKLPELASAKVDLKINGKFSLVAGPFDYHVWRTKVIARGRENTEAFWQLDGDSKVQQQEPHLAVVLRVPKRVKNLSAQGALIAYHDFDFWGAHLRDFWGDFRGKLKTFFSNGVPIESERKWDNIFEDRVK
jgi:hypothetical protein